MGNNLLNGSLWLLITYSRGPLIPMAITFSCLHNYDGEIRANFSNHCSDHNVSHGLYKCLVIFVAIQKTQQKQKQMPGLNTHPTVQRGIIILCNNPHWNTRLCLRKFLLNGFPMWCAPHNTRVMLTMGKQSVTPLKAYFTQSMCYHSFLTTENSCMFVNVIGSLWVTHWTCSESTRLSPWLISSDAGC